MDGHDRSATATEPLFNSRVPRARSEKRGLIGLKTNKKPKGQSHGQEGSLYLPCWGLRTFLLLTLQQEAESVLAQQDDWSAKGQGSRAGQVGRVRRGL